MKTVLFIVPMLSMVGQAKAARDIIAALKHDVHPYVITFNKSSEKDYPFDAEIINLEIEGSTNLLVKVFRFVKRITEVYRLKKKLRVDVTISFGEVANYINVLSKAGDRQFLVVGEHKSTRFLYDRGAESKIHSILMKILYPFAHRIVSVSKNVAQDMMDNFRIPVEKSSVVYNIIDIESIQARQDETLETQYRKIFSDNKVLINSGRVSRQKGQWHLVKIFGEVLKQHDGLKLVFLGAAEELDPQAGKIKEQIKRICEAQDLKMYAYWENEPISDAFDVYFLGFQGNPFKYIAQADLFVFPSLWEGFGLALAEAMVSNIPVVSADCKSGPREILAPSSDFLDETRTVEYAEYGILAPVLDGDYMQYTEELSQKERAWKEVIESLLDDEVLYRKYKQRSLAGAMNFSKQTISLEWKALIDEA